MEAGIRGADASALLYFVVIFVWSVSMPKHHNS